MEQTCRLPSLSCLLLRSNLALDTFEVLVSLLKVSELLDLKLWKKGIDRDIVFPLAASSARTLRNRLRLDAVWWAGSSLLNWVVDRYKEAMFHCSLCPRIGWHSGQHLPCYLLDGLIGRPHLDLLEHEFTDYSAHVAPLTVLFDALFIWLLWSVNKIHFNYHCNF